jgi:hypothetical protein
MIKERQTEKKTAPPTHTSWEQMTKVLRVLLKWNHILNSIPSLGKAMNTQDTTVSSDAEVNAVTTILVNIGPKLQKNWVRFRRLALDHYKKNWCIAHSYTNI